MNCWGWATWSDRWKFYEKNPDILIKTFNKRDINNFNINGSENFFDQIIKNQNGNINTWAIFWYATIFKNDGLCVNPNQSFTLNIGNDGSGSNKLKDKSYSSKLNLKSNFSFENDIIENKKAIKKLKKFYYRRFIGKIVKKLKLIRIFLKI